ncbi:MAG: hypothetical protein LBJ80_02250 [Rickettsiales bacterium]|nr:hypothetical protein [Rickettsiales bacterium]MDR1261223.1 hypothetical protein [Rickettsiales bacterium]
MSNYISKQNNGTRVIKDELQTTGRVRVKDDQSVESVKITNDHAFYKLICEKQAHDDFSVKQFDLLYYEISEKMMKKPFTIKEINDFCKKEDIPLFTVDELLTLVPKNDIKHYVNYETNSVRNHDHGYMAGQIGIKTSYINADSIDHQDYQNYIVDSDAYYKFIHKKMGEGTIRNDALKKLDKSGKEKVRKDLETDPGIYDQELKDWLKANPEGDLREWLSDPANKGYTNVEYNVLYEKISEELVHTSMNIDQIREIYNKYGITPPTESEFEGLKKVQEKTRSSEYYEQETGLTFQGRINLNVADGNAENEFNLNIDLFQDKIFENVDQDGDSIINNEDLLKSLEDTVKTFNEVFGMKKDNNPLLAHGNVANFRLFLFEDRESYQEYFKESYQKASNESYQKALNESYQKYLWEIRKKDLDEINQKDLDEIYEEYLDEINHKDLKEINHKDLKEIYEKYLNKVYEKYPEGLKEIHEKYLKESFQEYSKLIYTQYLRKDYDKYLDKIKQEGLTKSEKESLEESYAEYLRKIDQKDLEARGQKDLKEIHEECLKEISQKRFSEETHLQEIFEKYLGESYQKYSKEVDQKGLDAIYGEHFNGFYIPGGGMAGSSDNNYISNMYSHAENAKNDFNGDKKENHKDYNYVIKHEFVHALTFYLTSKLGLSKVLMEGLAEYITLLTEGKTSADFAKLVGEEYKTQTLDEIIKATYKTGDHAPYETGAAVIAYIEETYPNFIDNLLYAATEDRKTLNGRFYFKEMMQKIYQSEAEKIQKGEGFSNWVKTHSSTKDSTTESNHAQSEQQAMDSEEDVMQPDSSKEQVNAGKSETKTEVDKSHMSHSTTDVVAQAAEGSTASNDNDEMQSDQPQSPTRVKRSASPEGEQEQVVLKDTILKIEKSYDRDSEGKHKANVTIDYYDIKDLYDKAEGTEKQPVLKFWHKLAESGYKVGALPEDKYYFQDGKFVIHDSDTKKLIALPEDKVSIKIMKDGDHYDLAISKEDKVISSITKIDNLNYELLSDTSGVSLETQDSVSFSDQHNEYNVYLENGLGEIFNCASDYAYHDHNSFNVG